MSDDESPQDVDDVDVETRSTSWASKPKQWLRTVFLSPALAIGAGAEAVDSTVGSGWIPGSAAEHGPPRLRQRDGR